MRPLQVLAVIVALSPGPAAGQIPLRTPISPVAVLTVADSQHILLAALEGLRDTVTASVGARELSLGVLPNIHLRDTAFAAALVRAAATYRPTRVCPDFLRDCWSSSAAALSIRGIHQIAAGQAIVLFEFESKGTPIVHRPLTPSVGTESWQWEREMELLLLPVAWPLRWGSHIICFPCRPHHQALVQWDGQRWQFVSTVWWQPPTPQPPE